LPTWLFELHQLDLREFSHRCIERLPARLGYAEIALYFYNSEQDLLTLAETNSKRCVDLAISLSNENQHVLAVVARSGKPLSTNDLAATCGTAGMSCLRGLEGEPDHAALMVPLISDGRLRGLLQLNNRCRTDVSEVGLSLPHLFAFLARCLQHARQYERAHVEARVDRLTGMYNYRWLLETLGKEIRRSQRYGNPLALIMLDLDGLKPINDRFGHSAGDALLRHVARKVAATLRQIDSGVRTGGDEFVVLLPATDLAGARQVGQRILAAIRDDAPLINRQPLPVAASLGVAQWEDGWSEDRLLQAADKAMYNAKCEGHNQVVCHPHQAPTPATVASPVPHAQ
jgi:diguanylate cyclase (GGDEF)-like protein